MNIKSPTKNYINLIKMVGIGSPALIRHSGLRLQRH